MEITGYIKNLTAVQTSKNGNQFMEFVIEEAGERYPQSANLTIFGAKVQASQEILNSGRKVTVKFDVKAREYNGRWYTTLNAWSVTLAEAAQPTQVPAQTQVYAQQQAAQPLQAQINYGAQQPSDVPF